MWRNTTFQKFLKRHPIKKLRTNDSNLHLTNQKNIFKLQSKKIQSKLLTIKKHRSTYIKEILTNNSNQCSTYKYKKKNSNTKKPYQVSMIEKIPN